MFFACMASKYAEKHDLFTEINFPSMYFRQNLNYTASAVNSQTILEAKKCCQATRHNERRAGSLIQIG